MKLSRPTVEMAELIRTVNYADEKTPVALRQPSRAREMRVTAVEARTTSTPGAREYDSFIANWRKFEAEAKRTGFHPFYAPGYDRMEGRMAELAGRTDLPEHARQVLAKTLEVTGRLSERRGRVEGFLAAAKRNWQRRQELARESRAADIFLAQTAGYPEWRDDAERLHADGTAILADPDPALHLNEIALGRGRVNWAVDQIDRYRSGEALAEARVDAARTEPDGVTRALALPADRPNQVAARYGVGIQVFRQPIALAHHPEDEFGGSGHETRRVIPNRVEKVKDRPTGICVRVLDDGRFAPRVRSSRRGRCRQGPAGFRLSDRATAARNGYGPRLSTGCPRQR